MPQSYDGDIRLSASVEISTDDVQRKARNLKKSMDEILDSKDTKGNPKLEKLALQIQKSYAAVEKLQRKLNETQSVKVPTDQYKKLDAELEEARRKTDELAAAREKWEHATGTAKFFAAGEIEKVDAEMDKILNRMEELERKKAELESSGGAFQITGNTDQITQQLHFATANGEQLVGKFQEAASEAEKAASASNKVGAALKIAGTAAKTFGKVAKAAFNGIKSGIQAFKSGINKVKSGFAKLKTTVSKVFGHMDKSAKHGLKTLIKYGLGVRGLFALFRKLRGYATDAFKGIAQSSSSFNKTMSNITNTFGQFKNSIGTALQPIITIVEPILIRLMNLFINAANAVATFFATLTGQKYIYKAVKANNSYADSVEGAGKAAKEANKQLAEYDKLMVIQSQDAADAAGGSGGGGGGFTEELIDPTSSVSQFAQDLKEAWENEDFAAIGELVGSKINEIVGRIDEAIKWDNVGPKITKWVNNIGTAFNSLIDTINWPLIGQTIGDGLNTITYTIETFLDSFNIDELGTKFSQLVNSLNDTVDWEAIGRTTAKGLNEITGAINNFAYKTDWNSIGENIGSALSTLVDKVNAEELGKAIAAPFEAMNQTINGLLKNFEENGTWDKLGSNMAKMINSWFSSIDWKTVGENITLGVDGIVSSLDTLFDETSWKDIGGDLSEILNGVINIDWSKVGETIGDGAIGLVDLVSSAIAGTDWQQLGKDVVDLIMGVDWISLFKSAGNLVSQTISGAIDIVTGYLKEFDFKEVVKTLIGSIVGFLVGFDWSTFASKLMEFAGTLIGKLLAIPMNIADLINEFFINLVVKVVKYFTDKKSEWDEAGISVWEGIFQGIWNGVKNIATWIKEKIWDPFVNGFKSAFGIASPSKTMIELAGYLVDGLKEGLSNIWESIKGKFTEMLGKIKDWFSDKKNDLIAAWDKFKEGIGTVTATLTAIKDKAFDAAKEAWDSVKDKAAELKTAVEEKVKGALDSLKTNWESIKNKTSELWADAKEKTAGALASLKSGWDAIVGKTAELWADAKEKTAGALATIKSGWDAIAGKTAELWADAKEKTAGALATIKSGWDAIKGKTSELWADAKEHTSGALATIKSGWEAVKTKTSELTADAHEKTAGSLETIKSGWQAIKSKTVEIAVGFAKGVKDTVSNWWKDKIKPWFDGNKKGNNRQFEVGAKQVSTKNDATSWWDKVKKLWGTRTLSANASVNEVAFTDKAKGQLAATMKLYWNSTQKPGNKGTQEFASARGGVYKTPTHVYLGENGPEAVVPLKNNTEWLDIVSEYVYAHMKVGKVSIPKLAQGRVIPPNREFIAMLGDQKSGTNVETPLKTIEQALENVLSRARGGGQPIILQLDGKQIAQVVWNESDKRYKQTGRSYA